MPASKHKSSKSPFRRDYLQTITLFRKLFSIRLVRIVIIVLFAIFFTPIVLFFILRPKVQNDINYGVTFSDKYAKDLGLDWKKTYLNILDDLSAKNLRLVVYWDEVEPVNDKFDFENVRWQLDEAEKRDVNVILVVGRKVPRWPECFEPDWWREIKSEELRKIEVYEFIEQAAIALKDYNSIKMWQVENEPFWVFGECSFPLDAETIKEEIKIVRNVDDMGRPILVQDSGEGGLWRETYQLGDYLAISMYRKIWYDFWGILFGKFVYFQYPLAHWTYKIKADLVGVPYEKIIVTELQAEPWGPGINSSLTKEEKNKSMSRNDFLSTLSYAQKAGFKDLYLWGVEWWFWEKEVNDDSFYWDTAKALFN